MRRAVRGIWWVEVISNDRPQMGISEGKPHISSVNVMASTYMERNTATLYR